MPIQKTITAYTFQELLDLNKEGEVTETALSKARAYMAESVTFVEWHESVLSYWTDALAGIGFVDAKISYSGFWSQGDGASFTSEVDFERLVRFLSGDSMKCSDGEQFPTDPDGVIVREIGEVPRDEEYRTLYDIDGYVFCVVERTSHAYSHENTCEFRATLVEINRTKGAESIFKRFEEDAEMLRKRLSQCIYRDLMNEYESLTSDESLAETSELGEYLFDINGRLA